MKRLHFFLIALLLAILTACGGVNEEQPVQENNGTTHEEQANEAGENEEEIEPAFPVTIIDAVDDEVVIEEKPEKIISLMPSNTEILYALGELDHIVGVQEVDNYPEEVTDIEKVAGMEGLDVEKIISIEPDLVLAHGSVINMWEAGLSQLEDVDIPVLVIDDAQSFDEVFSTIAMVGEATGKKVEAEKLIEEMKDKLQALSEKASEITDEERKSVYIEVGPAPEIYTTGKGTFMDEMLEWIHADNAITEENDWIQISEEKVIELDPDVMILTYGYIENPVDQLLAREAWQDMKAVKEKQVYEVNEDLVSRPGPRIVEGVEEFAKAIYPEVFGE